MMKKIFSLFILSLLYSGSISAQESLDSYWEWYQNIKAEIASQPLESLIETKEEQLLSAQNLGEAEQESRIAKELAILHISRTSNLEKAMSLLIRSLEIDENTENEKTLLFTYLGFHQLFEKVEDYGYAEDFLLKASKILRKYEQSSLLLYINQKLGQTYWTNNQTGKALEQYDNILKYAKDERNPAVEATTYTELAKIYASINEYEKALEHYKDALSIFRRINNEAKQAICIHAIGDIYMMTNEGEKAYENYVLSLQILRQKNDFPEEKAAVYNSVAKYYLALRSPDRALANLRLSYPLALSSQNQPLLKDTYSLMSKAYRELGDYKKALEYSELKMALEDFIHNEKNDRKLLKMQSRYVLNQKQSLIDHLEVNRIQKEFELEEQKRFKNFLVILVGLVAIIFVLLLILFIFQRKSNKKLKTANLKVNAQNDELEDLNATKDKFFSIISHDLKGPLNSLTSFSGLLMNHTSSLTTEEIQMLAKDLDKSLKNLFSLLENLLQWSRSQTGTIEFTPEEFDLTEMLVDNKKLLDQQAENKNISIEVMSTRPILAKAHPNSVTTVVRNLLSNAIKFTNEGGQIKMGITEEKHQYVVKIADNGVGMPKEVANKIFRIDTKHSTPGTAKEKGTGLGLILCKEFIEKNGGKIWVKSEEGKGTLFSFSLPK